LPPHRSTRCQNAGSKPATDFATSINIAFRTAWRLCSVIEPVWRATLGYRRAPPITRQVLRMAAMPFTLDTTKARTELDYQPVVSRAEGLRGLASGSQPQAALSEKAPERTFGLQESRP